MKSTDPEADVSPAHCQRRPLRLADRARCGLEACDAVPHGADVLEQPAISHMIQCDMPLRRRAIAVAAATAPTPTAPSPITRSSRRRVDMVSSAMISTWLTIVGSRRPAPSGGTPSTELLHRVLGVARPELRVREQLDGGDVGVGVGDAPVISERASACACEIWPGEARNTRNWRGVQAITIQR